MLVPLGGLVALFSYSDQCVQQVKLRLDFPAKEIMAIVASLPGKSAASSAKTTSPVEEKLSADEVKAAIPNADATQTTALDKLQSAQPECPTDLRHWVKYGMSWFLQMFAPSEDHGGHGTIQERATVACHVIGLVTWLFCTIFLNRWLPGIAFAAARWVWFRRGARWSWLFGIAGFNVVAVSAMIVWTAYHWSHMRGVEPSLWTVSLVATCFMMHQMLRIYVTRRIFESTLPQIETGKGSAQPGLRLLRSQEELVQRIQERLNCGSWDDSDPGVLGLEGGWGSGKSHVIAELVRRGNENLEMIVLRVSIWKIESEADLHESIYSALAGHPFVFRLYGHLLPLRLALARLVREVRPLWPFGALSVGVVQLSLLAQYVLPLSWQRELEVLVDTLHCGHGKRVLVIFDELDRAPPAIVEAALALSRRALGIPHVATMIAYVPGIVEMKAFNPHLTRHPDLASTLFAKIAEEVQRRQTVQKPPTVPEFGSLASWQPDVLNIYSGDGHWLPGTDRETVFEMRWRRRLLEEWDRWPILLQKQIIGAARDKYLSPAFKIKESHISELASIFLDLAAVLWNLKLAPQVKDNALRGLENALALAAGKSPRMRPSFRNFRGISNLLLSSWPAAPKPIPPGNPVALWMQPDLSGPTNQQNLEGLIRLAFAMSP